MDTKVCASVEDMRAVKIMEETRKRVDGHYHVALPWRYDPPYLPNNKIVRSGKKRPAFEETSPQI